MVMATDSTQRFSNRVADDVKYRPRYPREALTDLESLFARTQQRGIVRMEYLTEIYFAKII
jgi:hypothetical protein